jgi:hypothetical protein
MPAKPFSDRAGSMEGLLFFGTDEFIITPLSKLLIDQYPNQAHRFYLVPTSVPQIYI